MKIRTFSIAMGLLVLCSLSSVATAGFFNRTLLERGPTLPTPSTPSTQSGCPDRDPCKWPFFGDLPPYQGGVATRRMKLDQPLDFAGVSDHAEYMAEANICFDVTKTGYYSPYCSFVRGTGSELFPVLDVAASFIGMGQVTLANPKFKATMCALNLWRGVCENNMESTWNEIQRAARDHNDECQFTTFTGYEWTGTPNWSNLHRNVFFKNDTVQARPVSYFETPHIEQFWHRLDTECNQADTGCEAIAIPHNSNLGGGKMFRSVLSDTGEPYDRETAAWRARMEPLIEIYQHKGASECIRGPESIQYTSDDTYCDFEQLYQLPLCEDGEGWTRDGCDPLCRDYHLKLGGGMSAS